MADILLLTLNSTYQHAAFGLRYILANMEELQERTSLMELTIAVDTSEVVSKVLERRPRILGLGVYIWNARQSLDLVRALKAAAPEMVIVLGGPEVSHESESQEICRLANFVVKGEGDFAFRDLCRELLAGRNPESKFLQPVLPDLKVLRSPYGMYTEEDVKNRVIYVEASRGCPYKCSYCLSSLDKSVRNFPLEEFLADMARLLERGVRRFKFVDRTFNLSPSISTRILEFFLNEVDRGLFLHFEMVPDRLPEELKALIEKFPPGALQFEIGIQSWNPNVAANVQRRQNYEMIAKNLEYLGSKTTVHTHVDLIVGLPGEDMQSFAAGFNHVRKLAPHEIQVGILKRLKGTPITRDEAKFGLVYDSEPPYVLLQNDLMSAEDMKTMSRFSRYWDAYANSGRFPGFMAALDRHGRDDFFALFMRFVRFLEAQGDETFGVTLERRAESAFRFLVDVLGEPEIEAGQRIYDDFCLDAKRNFPRFLRGLRLVTKSSAQAMALVSPDRQRRHAEASRPR